LERDDFIRVDLPAARITAARGVAMSGLLSSPAQL